MSTTASSAPTDSDLLEVDDLRVVFTQYARGLRRRTVVAVDGMHLHVAPGELVALVGASGAGKSLLAHAVLGQLPPNARESGVVRWRGAPVDVARRRQLAGHEVALLPQSVAHLDPTATVGSQIRRSARLAGLGDAARVARVAMGERGLDPTVSRRYPHQLSGGMGRRVLSAMAMLGSPALIIADEPTPGLHPADVTSALDRLRGAADAGSGVLLITHELTAALQVCDRVVVCRGGRTIDDAPSADFTGDGERLAHDYTRALWRALPAHGFQVPDRVPDDGETRC